MSKRTGQENLGGIIYQDEEEDWWHKLLHLRNKRGGRISPLGYDVTNTPGIPFAQLNLTTA
ncbi:hypothetical protein Tco_0712894, partial [Tanacetum coccineum]